MEGSAVLKYMMSKEGIENNMNGLSDKAQAIVTLVSASMIGIGATSIPAGAPPVTGIGLAIAGAIGLAIKEALGSKKSTAVAAPVTTPAK